jgi:hypothetical protein
LPRVSVSSTALSSAGSGALASIGSRVPGRVNPSDDECRNIRFRP